MGMIDLARAPLKTGSIYPADLAPLVAGRSSLRLSEAGGLTQFGANLVTLAAGARSSLRHWHAHEDEFVMIVEGRVVLLQDAGEVEMQAGDCAAFPAGDPDGHCFINKSRAEARFLVIGSRASHEFVTYSDLDLVLDQTAEENRFRHKDGSAYTPDPDTTP